jgi:bifunctional ADP-heptose synthase (sugar kinase/adenylyltransferase)
LYYDAGLFFQNRPLINNILAKSYDAGQKVVARPEKQNYSSFTGVDIAKFNLNLAREITGLNSPDETTIRAIANQLMNELRCHGLYLSYTDGDSYCVDGNQFEVIPPSLTRHGTSYVGTGSAEIAALTLMIAANAPLPLAARIAALAGAMSAEKQPVTYFSLAELQERFESTS